MRRFNLSAWAVAHPALILFLIVMFGVAGLLSYRNLGRAEDPSFTIKVVVVTAMWPGATAAEAGNTWTHPSSKCLHSVNATLARAKASSPWPMTTSCSSIRNPARSCLARPTGSYDSGSWREAAMNASTSRGEGRCRRNMWAG